MYHVISGWTPECNFFMGLILDNGHKPETLNQEQEY